MIQLLKFFCLLSERFASKFNFIMIKMFNVGFKKKKTIKMGTVSAFDAFDIFSKIYKINQLKNNFWVIAKSK